MNQPAQRSYEFSGFQLNEAQRLLTRNGEMISLPPKALDVLLFLLQNRGRILEKEELMKGLWPDAFVEEGNLTHNIFVLRKALGDDQNGNCLIQTIPRRGYRFVASVRELTASLPDNNVCIEPVGNDTEKCSVPTRNYWSLYSAFRGMQALSQKHSWSFLGNISRRIWLIVISTLLFLLAIASSYAWVRMNTRKEPRTSIPHPIQSLAVLPLANLSGDSSQDFFADGMTDELITVLTEIHSVQVTSRTSATRYRNSSKPLSQIARELQVDAVLEGAVVRSGEHVRVTVRLIDGARDRQLWAASYERPIADALTIQAEVAREVVRQIQAEITPTEAARLQRRRPIDPEVQEQYLLGWYYWNRRNSADLLRAAHHFQNAISVDPNYAPAYTGLADCYLILPIFNNDSAQQLLLRGKAAAQHAIQLDDSLGEAHASLASALQREWNFDSAEREYLRALELNPGYATGHQWYGEFLSGMNRMDEALEQYRLAMKLDPLSPVIHMEAALPYYYRGQYDEALRRLNDALKIDPSFPATHGQLGYVLSEAGNQEEALREFQRAVQGGIGDAPWIKAGIARAYARSGNRRLARLYLGQLIAMAKRSNLLGAEVASVLVTLGENDQAIQWLQRSYRQRDWELCGIGIAPGVVPLRGDLRMQELVRSIGLPSSATASWKLPSHSAKL